MVIVKEEEIPHHFQVGSKVSPANVILDRGKREDFTICAKGAREQLLSRGIAKKDSHFLHECSRS